MVVSVCGIDAEFGMAALRCVARQCVFIFLHQTKASAVGALSGFRNAIRFANRAFARELTPDSADQYSNRRRAPGINVSFLIVICLREESPVASDGAAKLQLSTLDLAEAIAAVSSVYCPHEVKFSAATAASKPP
jgi:hypothetical protein